MSLQGPWDQDEFEWLFTEWVVACDQPFDEVEKPKFIDLMEYTHHSGESLKLIKCDAVKRHTMEMGDETIEGVGEMFLFEFLIPDLWNC